MKKYLRHIILRNCSKQYNSKVLFLLAGIGLSVFLGFIPMSAISQSIEQTVAFADQQYELQNYIVAIPAYNRVIFFDKGELNKEIQPKLATCYLNLNEYNKALFHFNLAYTYEASDSISNEYLFQRALIFIIQKNFNLALQELLSVKESNTVYFCRKKEFYHGIIDLQNNQTESARQHFLSATDDQDSIKKIFIVELFNNYKQNKPNPKLAKTLSLIIPGSGQLYAGDWKNAANSALLTSSLAVLFVVVTHNYSLTDAVISIFPWFQRYYAGGSAKAGKIAVQKIEENKQLLYQQLLQVFLQY